MDSERSWAPLYIALIREGWRPLWAQFVTLKVMEIMA